MTQVRTGLQVFHETRSSPGLPRFDKFETKSGRFKLVSPRVYLFYYYPVPLFFKGTTEWNEGQVTMHARISLALTLILAFVVLGGFTLPFMAPPSTHVSVGMTATFLVMWTLMSIVFLLLVWRMAARRLIVFSAVADGPCFGHRVRVCDCTCASVTSTTRKIQNTVLSQSGQNAF
jgi:hypothetical protein